MKVDNVNLRLIIDNLNGIPINEIMKMLYLVISGIYENKCKDWIN